MLSLALSLSVSLSQMVYVLQGIDGKYVKYSRRADGFIVDASAGVPRATRHLCHTLSELGWLFLRVQRFVTEGLDNPQTGRGAQIDAICDTRCDMRTLRIMPVVSATCWMHYVISSMRLTALLRPSAVWLCGCLSFYVCCVWLCLCLLACAYSCPCPVRCPARGACGILSAHCRPRGECARQPTFFLYPKSCLFVLRVISGAFRSAGTARDRRRQHRHRQLHAKHRWRRRGGCRWCGW